MKIMKDMKKRNIRILPTYWYAIAYLVNVWDEFEIKDTLNGMKKFLVYNIDIMEKYLLFLLIQYIILQNKYFASYVCKIISVFSVVKKSWSLSSCSSSGVMHPMCGVILPCVV